LRQACGDPLDRGQLSTVQHRPHARLGQIAQHPLVGVELVSVGRPGVALRHGAKPTVAMPAEALPAHLMHPGQCASGPLPELRPLRIAGLSGHERLHDQVRVADRQYAWRGHRAACRYGLQAFGLYREHLRGNVRGRLDHHL
jgi:hypothetical protein